MVCNYNVEHSLLVVILYTVLLNLLEFYSKIPFPTDGENGKTDRAKLVNIAVESKRQLQSLRVRQMVKLHRCVC